MALGGASPAKPIKSGNKATRTVAQCLAGDCQLIDLKLQFTENWPGFRSLQRSSVDCVGVESEAKVRWPPPYSGAPSEGRRPR